MEILEYLTQNSLIAYPFKDRLSTTTDNDEPIGDDWFYDILFTSFSATLRSVYISRIAKTVGGDLSLTFSNAETSNNVDTVYVASAELINHYKNTSTSFTSYASENFAVKLVFGPGLPGKPAFDQGYTKEESTLTSSAVVLSSPRIDRITFETYDSTLARQLNLPDIPTVVKSYTRDSSPGPAVNPRHNSVFVLEGASSGGLFADSGIGDGLYNACPSGEDTSVYSINLVNPSLAGALFFNPSSCYTMNELTSSDVVLLGNYLDPYRNATIYTGPTTTTTKDVVSLGSALVLQNYCKPKCTPEDMSAFAYYLNRVTDGASALNKLATIGSETFGTGTASARTFTATTFCEDTTFLRCVDDVTGDSLLTCNVGFLKNYHEGRKLRLYYIDPTIKQYYTIVSVADDGQSVVLDEAPPEADTVKAFVVLDAGVIPNMNCATLDYNKITNTYTQPYFKVKYITSDSYDVRGKYVTFISVSVALFNPSINSVYLQALIGTQVLTRTGYVKLIKQDGTTVISDPLIVRLHCREYAFLELIYYIDCSTPAGRFTVDVVDVSTESHTPVGGTYTSPIIAGSPCSGTDAQASYPFRLTETNWESFKVTLNLGLNAFGLSYTTGSLPDWLHSELTITDTEHTATFTTIAKPPSDFNALYTVRFSLVSYPVEKLVKQLILDYVALPVIVYPPAPPQLLLVAAAKNVIYTEATPLFQVRANNMYKISDYFDATDAYYYTYSATGSDMPDLVFNQATGTITGSLATVLVGIQRTFNITAYNPAGNSVTHSIKVIVEAGALPG